MPTREFSHSINSGILKFEKKKSGSEAPLVLRMFGNGFSAIVVVRGSCSPM